MFYGCCCQRSVSAFIVCHCVHGWFSGYCAGRSRHVRASKTGRGRKQKPKFGCGCVICVRILCDLAASVHQHDVFDHVAESDVLYDRFGCNKASERSIGDVFSAFDVRIRDGSVSWYS